MTLLNGDCVGHLRKASKTQTSPSETAHVPPLKAHVPPGLLEGVAVRAMLTGWAHRPSCRMLQESIPGALVVKNLPAKEGDVRDTGSVSRWGRSPGGGHGNPLLYSCLENPMDGGACWTVVQGVANSWT